MLPGQFKPFAYPLPPSAAEWDREKEKLRSKLWILLGFDPKQLSRGEDPIRTLEFTSWFGEWDIHIKPPVRIIPVSGYELKEHPTIAEVRQYALHRFRGQKITNLDTDWVIEITRQGLLHSLYGKASDLQIQTITVIPELIQYAIKLKSERPREKNVNVPWIHHFLAPCDIDGYLYTIKIVVRETLQGKMYYDQSIVTKPPGSGGAPIGSNVIQPSGGFSTISIQELLKDIKREFMPSRIVGEDSRPLPVYRKSGHIYSTIGTGKTYYLSIKNPYLTTERITDVMISNSQAKGYDGIIRQMHDETDYAIFQEMQVRPAKFAIPEKVKADCSPIPKPRMINREQKNGYTLEKFEFENEVGDTVYGYLAIPDGRTKPCPAILYHHYHGNDYGNGKEEILKNYPVDKPPVESFTQAGYVVLAIDAYAFGERQHQGPAGKQESGVKTESALFKQFIWQGKTLWGMMVRDDQLALNYLLSRPEVDPTRIGATGMSMGSTRTWWLAALDDRIRAAVCVCCLTRYQNLLEQGENNQHGIYYYVPYLLKEGIDMEAVVGLIAPRPLLTQTGDRDDGSPVDGVHAINSFVGKVYGLYNQHENFCGTVYPGIKHEYTPEMWKDTICWFEKHLK